MGQAIDHSQSFVTQPFSSLQPLHIQPLQIDLQAATKYPLSSPCRAKRDLEIGWGGNLLELSGYRGSLTKQV
jgi:hypothetical protein